MSTPCLKTEVAGHETRSWPPVSEAVLNLALRAQDPRKGAVQELVYPRGYLTIVETKLWRNPEARREVVGQIVDYAKELSTWDVEELVASLAEADETKIGSTTKELYEYVRTTLDRRRRGSGERRVDR